MKAPPIDYSARRVLDTERPFLIPGTRRDFEESLDSDLANLNSLKVKPQDETDDLGKEKFLLSKRKLEEIQALGKGYVNALKAFNADRTSSNAKNVWRINGTISEACRGAVGQYPDEPAFSNQLNRGEISKGSNGDVAKTLNAMRGATNTGSIFNSMFSEFAGTVFFPTYLRFAEQFAPESAEPLRDASRSLHKADKATRQAS